MNIGWRVWAEIAAGKWAPCSGPWPFPRAGKALREYEVVRQHGYRGSYGPSDVRYVPEGARCRLVFDGEIASTIYDEWGHKDFTEQEREAQRFQAEIQGHLLLRELHGEIEPY